MKNKRILAVALLAAATFQISGASSKDRVTFDSSGVRVEGLKPGTRIVWMALTRTRVGNHARLSMSRGSEIATPAGKVAIGRPGADKSRSLWALAAADDALALSSTPSGYVISRASIQARAEKGAESIAVDSPAIELMLVTRPGHAWFVTAADGGAGDADGVQNTTIQVDLGSLEALHGGGRPPSSLGEGDIILMIDPVANRIATVEVAK